MKRVLMSLGFEHLSLPCEVMPYLKDVELIEDTFTAEGTLYLPKEDQSLRVRLIDESQIRRDRIEVLNQKAIDDKEQYRRWWQEEEEKRKKIERELKELKGES